MGKIAVQSVINKIRIMHTKQCMSLEQIGQHFGVSASSIERWLKMDKADKTDEVTITFAGDEGSIVAQIKDNILETLRISTALNRRAAIEIQELYEAGKIEGEKVLVLLKKVGLGTNEITNSIELSVFLQKLVQLNSGEETKQQWKPPMVILPSVDDHIEQQEETIQHDQVS